MPIARSSDERLTVLTGFPRATADVLPLVRFRASALRGGARAAAVTGLAVIGLLTVLAAWLPSRLDGAGMPGSAQDVRAALPVACGGALFLWIVAAVSGGGRELLPDEQAVAFPVSPTTDHLGALLMAPLNMAWLVQMWALLGMTAYAMGGQGHLIPAQAPMVLWIVGATVLAQLVAWAAEWMRRGPGGVWSFRAVAAGLSSIVAVIAIVGGRDALGATTAWIPRAADRGADGEWLAWSSGVASLLVLIVVGMGAGAWAAHQVARRPRRDELRSESARRPPRANPTSDLAALIRIDRTGIWRSIPIRRGFLVLATLPGLCALAGGVHWETVSILPGPIAAAAALLFGVNSWSLDGRGALWRGSLPVAPRLVFVARATVLLEFVVLGLVLTVVLATLRAGLPTVTQLAAVLCAIAVGSLQVVSASMRWSVRRPFSADLRSARATPAPPLTMVGYSTRLASSTTLTGFGFALTAGSPHWYWSLVLAAPLLLLSARGLRRAARLWADPQQRSHIIATVAG